ncbi:alpha/beta fold hydrolase [Acetobacter nitrogenifigens]|nr:alpha/beta hydrolase [Acetobacter nitrogenifigens]
MIFSNGLNLHGSQSGQGELAVLFLHYWGGTARTWDRVVSAMPDDVRSIALDARGWGGSPHPEHGYDIATMADDVEGAIATLGLTRYLLVGHSMGGKVAQLLASRRPAGLAGLVLVAPSPAQGKILPEPEREAMKGAYMTPEGAAWTLDNILCATALPQELRDQVIADSLGGASAAKIAWPTSAISEDVSADLDRIQVPILVIGGEKDVVDSVDLLRTVLLPSLPTATLVVVPKVGHLLPLEAPSDVAGHIRAFLMSEQSR